MPDLADYKVVSDNNITLQTGGDIDATFNPDLGTTVKHDQHGILLLTYESLSNANNLSFQVSLNGTALRTITMTGAHSGTLHEVFFGVTKNGVNPVDLRIVGGSGSVRISDIVLFVRRPA